MESKLLAPDTILLSLARHCISFCILNLKPRRVYFPSYTCSSVVKTIKALGVKTIPYHVDENLLPKAQTLQCLGDQDLIILNDYFGLLTCSKLFNELIGSIPYHQVLIDATQSLTSDTTRAKRLTVYSPRKFLPVTDGGILLDPEKYLNKNAIPTDIDSSWDRVQWLFRSVDEGLRKFSYNEFLVHRSQLQLIPYAQMSPTTRLLLSCISIDSEIEIINYNIRKYMDFHQHGPFSPFVRVNSESAPIGFPVYVENADLVRRQLATIGIYACKYWGMEDMESLNESERLFADRCIFLPVSQRIISDESHAIMQEIISS